jgi:hypothetical protein
MSGTYTYWLDQYFEGPFIKPSLGKVLWDRGDPPDRVSTFDTTKEAWSLITRDYLPSVGDSAGTAICVLPHPESSPDDPAQTGEHSWTIMAGDLLNYPNETPVLWASYGARSHISSTFSHELVETITDPGGDALQVNPTDRFNWHEIGDVCESCTGLLDGVVVESYWSEAHKSCIIPYTAPVTSRQVTCIRKRKRNDARHPIRWVAGIDIPSGQPFEMLTGDVMRRIASGHRFFVGAPNGQIADIKVFVHFPPWQPTGSRYLATVADDSLSDNLLSLPECAPGPLDRVK